MNQAHVADLVVLQYGRAELKKIFQKYYVRGLIISVAIHLCVVGSYYGVEYLGEEEEIPMVRVRVMKYSDLGPPPSIAAAPMPPSIAVAAAAKPKVGVPVPVPDAEVSPEATIPTQQEMSTVPTPALEDLGDEGGFQIEQDIVIEDEDPGINEFIPVEKLPQIVKKVMPDYPEMALRAGLEGTVWVKVLVDQEGKPKKAVVIKSTTEIFNDSAVDAAMQFIFTPAVMNEGPVKVWVSIPFKFRLKDVTPS